jgi:hypothetical protein
VLLTTPWEHNVLFKNYSYNRSFSQGGEKKKICDMIAGQFYLTRDEYIAPLQQDCWKVLATEWSSPEFKKKPETNRANHGSRKFKPHKGGSNSIATIRQKLVSVQLLFFF